MELVLCKQNTNQSQSYGGSEIDSFARGSQSAKKWIEQKWREKPQWDATWREIGRIREIPDDFPFSIGLGIISYMWVLWVFLMCFQ